MPANVSENRCAALEIFEGGVHHVPETGSIQTRIGYRQTADIVVGRLDRANPASQSNSSVARSSEEHRVHDEDIVPMQPRGSQAVTVEAASSRKPVAANRG